MRCERRGLPPPDRREALRLADQHEGDRGKRQGFALPNPPAWCEAANHRRYFFLPQVLQPFLALGSIGAPKLRFDEATAVAGLNDDRVLGFVVVRGV